MAQTVTIGEQKVYPESESESLKFSVTPTPQVENPSDSDSMTPTPQPWTRQSICSNWQVVCKDAKCVANAEIKYSYLVLPIQKQKRSWN